MFDLAPEPVSARPGLAKVLATQDLTDKIEETNTSWLVVHTDSGAQLDLIKKNLNGGYLRCPIQSGEEILLADADKLNELYRDEQFIQKLENLIIKGKAKEQPWIDEYKPAFEGTTGQLFSKHNKTPEGLTPFKTVQDFSAGYKLAELVDSPPGKNMSGQLFAKSTALSSSPSSSSDDNSEPDDEQEKQQLIKAVVPHVDAPQEEQRKAMDDAIIATYNLNPHTKDQTEFALRKRYATFAALLEERGYKTLFWSHETYKVFCNTINWSTYTAWIQLPSATGCWKNT